jgi:flavin reductase (DIM6/NTAB) family NADH-FMN oxidoreductase RutF
MPGLDRESFRRACAQFATGITVVTSMGIDGQPHGLTANSFTSVSLEPPMCLFCIDRRASVHEHFDASAAIAIHVLAEDQVELCVAFSQRPTNRFEGLKWQPGENGAPVLEGALAVFLGEVRQKVDAGTHTIFIAEVKRAACRSGAPLLYFNSAYRKLAE